MVTTKCVECFIYDYDKKNCREKVSEASLRDLLVQSDD